VAQDQNGAQIPVGAGTASYSSSAPDVAEVSASGLVAATMPGTAEITATFIFGGKTQSASMNAVVHEGPAEYPDLAGVYDLKTLLTISGWGMEGTRTTAVITIEHSGDKPQFAGTFADFYYSEDETPRSIPLGGRVSGSVDCVGTVDLELHSEGPEGDFWQGKGRLISGQIVGDFIYPSDWQPDEGGTFTATRR
jgi:hypothetical protein